MEWIGSWNRIQEAFPPSCGDVKFPRLRSYRRTRQIGVAAASPERDPPVILCSLSRLVMVMFWVACRSTLKAEPGQVVITWYCHGWFGSQAQPWLHEEKAWLLLAPVQNRKTGSKKYHWSSAIVNRTHSPANIEQWKNGLKPKHQLMWFSFLGKNKRHETA